MNSRKSSIILKYNDKKATETITNDMESFTWVDCASGEADTLSLNLNNRNMKWFKKGWFPQKEDVIKASIKVQHWRNQSDNRTVFCGRFAVDECSGTGFPNTVSISGICVPIRTGFNVTQRNKTYKSTTVKNIMQQIADRADVKLVFQATDISVKEVSQSGKTDMEFAFSLCGDYDLAMKVYNNKLVVYNQTKYERRKKSFTLDACDLGENGSYQFNRSITKIYDGVKYQYTNGDGDSVTYEYVVPGEKGKRLLFLSVSADSHADAERKARAKLAANLREAVTAEFTLMGDPKYQACQTFTIKGFGKWNGKYFIDKATHNKSGKYTVSIECHKCVTNIS